LIAAAQEQFRQSQPYNQQQQGGEMRGNSPDDSFDDGDDDQPGMGGEPFAPREQQPFYPREQQQPQPQPQHVQNVQPRPQQYAPQANDQEVDRLPSFITGGQPAHQQPTEQGPGPTNAPTNSNGYDGQSDRFPLHRRRRRHRGPRDHGGDNDSPTSSGPRSIDD